MAAEFGLFGTTSPHTMASKRPERERRPTDQLKRKQTLIALINQLSEEEEMGMLEMRAAREKKFKSDSVDDRYEAEGVESFKKFEEVIRLFDQELQQFSNGVRHLGSSIGLVSSAFYIRQRLAHIIYLFRLNAAELFPRHIERAPLDVIVPMSRRRQGGNKRGDSRPTSVISPFSEGLEALPNQLQRLGRELSTFLDHLNDYPQLSDEPVIAYILLLDKDLKYWGSTLQDFRGQFRISAVQRYVHDFCGEIYDHLNNITASMSTIVEFGIPAIQLAQQRESSGILNLSSTCAFFSGVTATMLQYSVANTQSVLGDVANAFLFASLILGVAATANSALVVVWKNSTSASPAQAWPWFVVIWTKLGPLILLVLSSMAFSAGVALFTVSTQQQAVIVIVLLLSLLAAVSLIAMLIWFAWERVGDTKHRAKIWWDKAAEIEGHALDSARDQLREKAERVGSWTSEAFSGARRSLRNAILSSTASGGDRSTSLPTTAEATHTSSNAHIPLVPQPQSLRVPRLAPSSGALRSAALPSGSSRPTPSRSNSNTEPIRPKNRFADVGWKVANIIQSTSTTRSNRSRKDRESTQPVLLRSRMPALVPALKRMREQFVLDDHVAMVRHLQFSPNGTWLATCSWDRTCRIWQVPKMSSDPFNSQHVLEPPSGFVGQVAWSPDSSILLLKLARTIMVWQSQTWVCLGTIDRPHVVSSVTWLPSGKGFLSVEGRSVYSLDLQGTVLDLYTMERFDLRDVAVSPDQQRLFAIATVVESAEGVRPGKSKTEKRIVAYNMALKVIESQVPILQDARDIVLSRDGGLALVSYDAKTPPQLWRIDKADSVVRLNLSRTYIPESEVDFAGTSHLAGVDTELVISPTKSGDVLVWDRDTGDLLHSIHVQGDGDELTAIAWKSSAKTLTIASAYNDGDVRIWASRYADDMFNGDGDGSGASGATSTAAGTPSKPRETKDYFSSQPMSVGGATGLGIGKGRAI